MNSKTEKEKFERMSKEELEAYLNEQKTFVESLKETLRALDKARENYPEIKEKDSFFQFLTGSDRRTLNGLKIDLNQLTIELQVHTALNIASQKIAQRVLKEK